MTSLDIGHPLFLPTQPAAVLRRHVAEGPLVLFSFTILGPKNRRQSQVGAVCPWSWLQRSRPRASGAVSTLKAEEKEEKGVCHDVEEAQWLHRRSWAPEWQDSVRRHSIWRPLLQARAAPAYRVATSMAREIRLSLASKLCSGVQLDPLFSHRKSLERNVDRWPLLKSA